MVLDASSTYVSTMQVAKALGLSVSTVKRWVDEGVLPAYKTPGGHRKLLLADVISLARQGDLPHADLSKLMEPRRGRQPAEPHELANSLYESLLADDRNRVRALIHGSYRHGIPIARLADEAIGPAMHRIGRDWADGRIDVMEEHRATHVCAATLFELKAILELGAEKNRPRAVGGAIESDFSLLPTLLAEMVLLDAGWEAINLGPNTPFPSFSKAIHDLRPKLIWLTVSHLVSESEFLTGYRELYRRAEKAGVAVAIGGGALVESIRSQIPYTTYGDGLAQLSAFARTLHPKPAPPRRGRPRKS